MEDRLDREQVKLIQEQLRSVIELVDIASANEIQKEVMIIRVYIIAVILNLFL